MCAPLSCMVSRPGGAGRTCSDTLAFWGFDHRNSTLSYLKWHCNFVAFNGCLACSGLCRELVSLMSPISVLLRYFERKSTWYCYDWENYEQSLLSNLLLLGSTNVSQTCKTTNTVSSTCYRGKIWRPILGTGIKNTSVYRSQLLGTVYTITWSWVANYFTILATVQWPSLELPGNEIVTGQVPLEILVRAQPPSSPTICG